LGGCLDREYRCVCIWHVPNVFFKFASFHMPLWNTWKFIIPWPYVCNSTLSLPSRIVSGLANLVYNTKQYLLGVMCRFAPLSQYQQSASTMLAREVPITSTRNASSIFFPADLPSLSPACCWFWGHSAAQWQSCLHLLQGLF
jgi:hypothetical protein